MSTRRFRFNRAFALLFGVFFAGGTLVAFSACESYDNGTTRSKTTKTVETPNEKTTTTTTHEKKVEPY